MSHKSGDKPTTEGPVVVYLPSNFNDAIGWMREQIEHYEKMHTKYAKRAIESGDASDMEKAKMYFVAMSAVRESLSGFDMDDTGGGFFAGGKGDFDNILPGSIGKFQ